MKCFILITGSFILSTFRFSLKLRFPTDPIMHWDFSKCCGYFLSVCLWQQAGLDLESMPPFPPTELIEVQSSLFLLCNPSPVFFLQVYVDQSVRSRKPRTSFGNSPCWICNKISHLSWFLYYHAYVYCQCFFKSFFFHSIYTVWLLTVISSFLLTCRDNKFHFTILFYRLAYACIYLL